MNFITPQTFLDLYKPHLLCINSTEDARKTELQNSREALYGSISSFSYLDIYLRYEPDLNRLFISTAWLRELALADSLDAEYYIRELKNWNQYMGHVGCYLLKGTGHKSTQKQCLLFDLSVACAPAPGQKKEVRWPADPYVDPQLKSVNRLQKSVREHRIDEESAKHLLSAIRKERILLERLKYGAATDTRKLLSRDSKRVVRAPRQKLAILAYAKDLNQKNLLMVRQVTRDSSERVYQKEVIVDAEGDVLGYLKETARERRLYLVVSDLRKSVKNYRQDYRYTHSQTTYLMYSKVDGLHPVNKYCAVFDLRKEPPKDTAPEEG